MAKYIDAEGVMRACYDSFLKTGNKAYKEIFALIEAVPAADVVEVRHGRWVQDGTGYHAKCSVCGELVYRGWYYSFCPNCGASMVNEDE